MDATWQERFAVDGYTVFEGFLEPDHGERLRADVDELMARRKLGETPMIISLPELGLLTSHPPVLELVTSLMGGEFALHHIHASRHDTGREGVGWHQDYEQYPQTNRTHLMVHVFYYLNGLNGEVGDLILLPRSQGLIFGRNEHQVFGTADLPGSVVVDLLAPGSVVIVHSAMLHGRRPKPRGENSPRYFVDVSYCQRGIRWPGYGGEQRYDEINRFALESGLDRDGRYAFVYDSDQFFDTAAAAAWLAENDRGSLAERFIGDADSDR